MATHDYVIANGTGAAVRSDLNDALAAIVSNNSGSSEPATTYAYQWWADTTANVLKIRNSANNAWITLRELDGTMLIEDGSASSPGLSFASDTNSGLFGGSDTIGFATGGAERLEIGSSEVVFNDPSNDVDFRVESNGQTHMLFVDAGNDRVGIAKSSPSARFHIGGTAGDFKIEADGATIDFTRNGANYIQAAESSATLNYRSSQHIFTSSSLSDERARIDSSGRLLVGVGSDLSGGTSSTAIQLSTTGGGFLGLARNDSTVSAGNSIGGLRVYSNAPSGYNKVADFRCEADGTFATDDYPSRWVLTTTADGASSATERVRIDSSGRLGVGLTPSSAASITNVDAGLIQTDGNIDIRYPGSNSDPAGARYLSFVNTDSTLVAGQPMGGIRWVGNDTSNLSRDTASILAFCSGNTGNRSQITFNNDGGTERLRLDSDGRLLVGASSHSSSAKFVVQARTTDSSSYANISFQKGAAPTTSNPTLAAINFTDNSERQAAYIAGAFDTARTWTDGSSHPGRLVFATTANGASSSTERMRILSHGSLRVSTARTDSDYAQNDTDYWHAFHHHFDNQAVAVIEHSGNNQPYGLIIDFSDGAPDDNTRYFLSCLDQTTIRLQIKSDGDVVNHDNIYGAISDVKLKQDIVDAGSQWDDIKNLRVRKFRFKSDVADYGDEAKTLIGVVAQETELVSPGLVKESPDLDKHNNDLGTTTKSVRYSVLYMKAVKALQEAQTRIEALESQHADLLARVAALEAN